jgi:uncharacterized protein YdeI (YjbR/CyaY-like superfamily)
MAGERLEAANRAGWRAWLRQNHARAEEVWLVYYKKATGKPSVGYKESVEEAICFGWIDGLKKRIDDERYCHRFSPRRESSKWTPANIEIAERMIAQKKMAAAGRRAFDRREEYDPGFLAERSREPVLSPELEKALRADRPAWDAFEALSPGCRKEYVQWLMSAKREATREKRLVEARALLRKGKKLGMR